MSLEPPPFQEAARCNVCNCNFNTFRRRHHCRCCGKTLCHDHSSDQMALPQFGIYSNVRVCSDCFNNSRSGEDNPQLSNKGVDTTINAVSRLDVGNDVNAKAEPTAKPQLSAVNIPECKCGMPLCICEAPAPAPGPDPLLLQQARQVQSGHVPLTQPNPRMKKMDHAPKNASSASNSKASSFFNLQTANGSWQKPQTDYEVNGEGLKEAIKNSDTVAVKKLLSEGVDSNYCDKQGFSLLHLAAVFNQTEISFILMDYGANVECKNQQGETPLDCAPPMLQHKMKNKMTGQQP